MSKRKYFYRYRSSETGKFVSRAYAEANPRTTMRERVLLPEAPR